MRTPRYITIGLLIMLGANTAFAAGEAGKFLSWGAGARSLGMANAYTGVVDDVYATYWNPAALGTLQNKEVGAFHATLWEDTIYDFLAYAHPVLDKGTFGVSVIRLYSGGADKRDDNNVSLGTFANQQMAVGASYGTNVYNNKVFWGVTGKYINMTLDTFSQTGFSFDSALYYAPSKALSMGLNIQNLIANISGNTDDQLPVVVKFGTGYWVLKERILMAFDYDRTFNQGSSADAFAVGFEGRVNRMIALRLGKNQDEITAGFGLTYKTLNLDYAMGSNFLGPSQRVSLNFKFGRSLNETMLAKQPKMFEELLAPTTSAEVLTPEDEARKEEMQAKFRDTYQAGVGAYNKGLYIQSLDHFTLAQKIDPTDPSVPIYQERLKLIVPIVPQNISMDKASVLTRRGIAYFMEGNGEAAVKTIAYALSTEPDNFTISRLLTRIEEKTGFKVEYAKPVSGMSIVDQKLYECLMAFRQKDYSKVISICEEVLILEPNNILAYKRLGSAFFALGDKEKAVQTWRKALRISPDDSLRKMIQEIEQPRQQP